MRSVDKEMMDRRNFESDLERESNSVVDPPRRQIRRPAHLPESLCEDTLAAALLRARGGPTARRGATLRRGRPLARPRGGCGHTAVAATHPRPWRPGGEAAAEAEGGVDVGRSQRAARRHKHQSDACDQALAHDTARWDPTSHKGNQQKNGVTAHGSFLFSTTSSGAARSWRCCDLGPGSRGVVLSPSKGPMCVSSSFGLTLSAQSGWIRGLWGKADQGSR